MATKPVGIDDLNVYGSTLSVNARTVIAARGGAPGTADRLSLVRRSACPPWEDAVTLAVNAARPLVNGPDDVQLLVVATESGLDDAKPLSAYVHRHLGLSERTFHLEVKHACFGATAALQLASTWVAANPGQRALVVATDLARRAFHHPAEPVEGAGAAAMTVATDPRVLALDPHRGFAAREVYDVRRPTRVLEASDAELSLAAYLDLLEIAWEGYAKSAGADAFGRLDHLVFHSPLVGLVRQAHRVLAEDHVDDIAAHFAQAVSPSLAYCQELGNLYGGALYAALASLVEHAPTLAPDATVGLYAYGSGSGACFFSGRLGSQARNTVARHSIPEHLARRSAIDVPTSEAIVMAHERSATGPDFLPDYELVPGLFDEHYDGQKRLVLDNVQDYYRSYRWA